MKNKPKILIIDDDPNCLELLRINLEYNGYQVATASGGADGYGKVLLELPDVIILDICLPDINGWQVCDMLKKNKHGKNIPVVFLSASSQKDDLERSKLHEADMFLTKPFDPAELIQMLNSIMIRKSRPNHTGNAV
ncbi:MAG: response regulator [bacterium]